MCCSRLNQTMISSGSRDKKIFYSHIAVQENDAAVTEKRIVKKKGLN